MAHIIHQIDQYEISLELAHSDEGETSKTYAMITLFSEHKNVAELTFLRPGFLSDKKYLSGNQLNAQMSSKAYYDTVDLLRNEKPLRLIIYYEGTLESPTHIEARLATSELETVGKHDN